MLDNLYCPKCDFASASIEFLNKKIEILKKGSYINVVEVYQGFKEEYTGQKILASVVTVDDAIEYVNKHPGYLFCTCGRCYQPELEIQVVQYAEI